MTAPRRAGVWRRGASPIMLLVVAIASVQFGSALAKDLYAAALPVQVAWLRLLGAAVLLGTWARPRLRGRQRADWAWVIGYGLCLAGMNVSFYLAIDRIPIGMAVTVEFLGPLGVALAASRRVRDLAWVALAGVGVAALGFSPGALDPVGVLWALLAGALWAGYIMVAAPTGRRWPGVTGVTVAMWVGLVALTPLLVVRGELPALSAGVWGVGLMIGVLSSALPYALEMVALRTLAPRVFGILMALEPVAAALFAWMVLGEGLRLVEVAAMACVVAASIGVVRTSGAS